MHNNLGSKVEETLEHSISNKAKITENKKYSK